MNIELTQDEIAEIKIAVQYSLSEVKAVLNSAVIHHVDVSLLKPYMYRKRLLTALLDKLEED